jgi:hypothetical protein
MAWAIVGVGTAVETVTTSLTLTEPASCASGDLLVCCIAHRIASTSQITVPSGWSTGAQITTNNVVAGTTGHGSAKISYIVRGASAPALTWTLPVAPSVARGVILAYRGGNPTTPVDVTSIAALNTATNVTAISLAGGTTLLSNDLLIAMIADGSASMLSAFKSANVPSTASGSTLTGSTPSNSSWTERHDSSSATGADVGLGVFDAVKTPIGATGTFTATATVASGHALAVTAFRIASTANAWDAADLVGLTLTSSDRTASSPVVPAAVRTTQGRALGTAGKYYGEFVPIISSGAPNIGIKLSTATINNTTSSFYMDGDGDLFISGTTTGVNIGTPTSSQHIGMAIDMGAKRAWMRLPGGNWNGSATADPTTNVGGIDISALTVGTYEMWHYDTVGVASCGCHCPTAFMTQPGPNGFQSWMGEALTIFDVNVFETTNLLTMTAGNARVPLEKAWNTVDRTISVALSNNDKTAFNSGSVRSTRKQLNGTAGKYYAEFLWSAAGTGLQTGIQDATVTLTDTTKAAYVIGTNGTIYVNGVSSGVTLGTPVNNDVICMAWDAGTEKIWFRKNGGLWNNSASDDPATGTGGHDFSAAAAINHALWFTSAAPADTATIRTELAEYTQTVPIGFKSWMNETPAINVSVDVTGELLTSTVGNVTVDASFNVSVDVTGELLTSTVGDATVIGGISVEAIFGTLALGTVTGFVDVTADQSIAVDVTGESLAATAGAVTVSVPTIGADPRQYFVGGALGTTYVNEEGARSYATLGGYVVDTFVSGPVSIEVNVTSNLMTVWAGNATAGSIYGVNVDATTNLLTTATSTPTVNFGASGSPATNLLTMSIGIETVEGDGFAYPPTNLLAMTAGDATVSIGATNVSANVSTNLLTTETATATVIGKANTSPATNLLTAETSTPTVTGKANVMVAWEVLNIAIGTETVSVKMSAFPPGHAMTIAVGDETVSIKASGSPASNLMTMAVGNVGVDTAGNTSVGLTTPPVLTMAIGDVTIVGKANVAFTTPPALIASLGTVSVRTSATAIITGIPPLNAFVGNVQAGMSMSVMVGGLQLNMQMGNVFVSSPSSDAPAQKEGIMLLMTKMMGS